MAVPQQAATFDEDSLEGGDNLCALDLRYHATRYGTEAILVVDDKREVPAVATSILHAEGHTTLGALTVPRE